MGTDINREAWQILESEEFNTLLEAVELMAKAQGNLFHLTKSVNELKCLVDSGSDSLPIADQAAISDLVDSIEVLVEDLTSNTEEH